VSAELGVEAPYYVWRAEFACPRCAARWTGRSGPAATPRCPSCGSVRFHWANHPHFEKFYSGKLPGDGGRELLLKLLDGMAD